jgi:hypothetical protein
MPKKRSKADQRNILSNFAKQQRRAELKKRLKSDGDSAEHPSVLPVPQDNVLVSHDTSNDLGDSQEFPTPSSNNALHLAQAGASAQEVGRESAGEGVEAAREGGQGRGSESSIRAARGSESTLSVNVLMMAPIAQASREEAREEVGREGTGEGRVEAAQEGGQGRGSESSIPAARGSESTRGVHADTGVFSDRRRERWGKRAREREWRWRDRRERKRRVCLHQPSLRRRRRASGARGDARGGGLQPSLRKRGRARGARGDAQGRRASGTRGGARGGGLQPSLCKRGPARGAQRARRCLQLL